MFIIDFRNKLVSNNNFSVMGNNNVDTVYLFSHFTQYASGYNVYLKVISEDERYVDKILIDSENISIVDGALLVKWTMGEVSTQCKKIDIQLQFENNDGSIIAQTRITSITLADTIDVDGEIPIIYPKILSQLQEQIDTLKADSVAGYTMSYDSDTLIINLLNKNGDVVATNQITLPFSEKVDKVEGYGLSKNDFTDELKTKLEGIASGAQVNVLEGVQVNGTDLPINEKKVNIDLTGKVDKSNSSNKVYGTDNSGNQTTYDLDNGTGYSGNVARRDSNGQMHVPQTPTANDHATSKKYVDDEIATMKRNAFIDVDTTAYPTLNDFLASTGVEGYIYLYPIDTSDLTKGYYQYIWEASAWRSIGTTQIDLSDYYTKTETDTLLGAKADQSSLSAHTGDTNNPHSVTKAQVGLGNVDNTSDQNKPVSTAQQQALDLKADKSTTYTKTEVDTALASKQNDVCLSVADGKLCITYEA